MSNGITTTDLAPTLTIALCNTDEMEKHPPYIAEVQDGSHNLYSYVWVPLKIQTPTTLPIASYTRYDYINGTTYIPSAGELTSVSHSRDV